MWIAMLLQERRMNEWSDEFSLDTFDVSFTPSFFLSLLPSCDDDISHDITFFAESVCMRADDEVIRISS